MSTPPEPKIDPESPAAKIAAKFDKRGNPRANALAKALGRNPSTVHKWLVNGFIPATEHGAVVEAGRVAGITFKPAEFVDGRLFAKAGA